MATATMVETNARNLPANGALAIYRRVVYSSGQAAYASATQPCLGVTLKATFAANDPVGVQLRTACGTVKMTASGAITAGATVYAAASGKVAATGTVAEGQCLNAAAADGDIVEVLMFYAPAVAGATENTATVAAAGSSVSDATAVVTSSPGFTLVTAADGTKGVILPTGTAGQRQTIKNADAANAILKVYPPTGGVINALSTNAAISMAAKTCATFECYDGTTWYTCPLVPS